MKFNFHAVSKKERIRKTLLLGIPATLLIGLVGGMLVLVGRLIGFNIAYYFSVMAIGYVTGSFVRIIGKGTTPEFLVIAGIFGFIATFIAMYMSYVYSGTTLPFGMFISLIFDFTNLAASPSFIELAMSTLVSVYLSNTVQM